MHQGVHQSIPYSAAGALPPQYTYFEKYCCSQAGCGVAEIRDEDLGKREESLVTTIKLMTHFSFNNATMTRLGSWLLWSAIFVATLAAGSQGAHRPKPKKTVALGRLRLTLSFSTARRSSTDSAHKIRTGLPMR